MKIIDQDLLSMLCLTQNDIELHPSYNDCTTYECLVCAIRDCPQQEPLHYHHDGCPWCSRINNKE